LAERVAHWDKEYVARYPELFEEILYKRASKADALAEAFPRWDQVEGSLRTLDVRAMTAEALSELARPFPETALALDLYFLVCDFGFGGMSSREGDRTRIVVCVEQPESEATLQASLAHELFHALHQTENPGIDTDERVAARVMEEGLATLYLSCSDPSLPLDSVIFGSATPEGWVARMENKPNDLMELLAADLGKTDRASKVRWIGFSRIDARVPEAAAYALGAIVVSEIVSSDGREGALRLGEERLVPRVRDAIESVMVAAPDRAQACRQLLGTGG
jgi:hypothetical protein